MVPGFVAGELRRARARDRRRAAGAARGRRGRARRARRASTPRSAGASSSRAGRRSPTTWRASTSARRCAASSCPACASTRSPRDRSATSSTASSARLETRLRAARPRRASPWSAAARRASSSPSRSTRDCGAPARRVAVTLVESATQLLGGHTGRAAARVARRGAPPRHRAPLRREATRRRRRRALARRRAARGRPGGVGERAAPLAAGSPTSALPARRAGLRARAADPPGGRLRRPLRGRRLRRARRARPGCPKAGVYAVRAGSAARRATCARALAGGALRDVSTAARLPHAAEPRRRPRARREVGPRRVGARRVAAEGRIDRRFVRRFRAAAQPDTPRAATRSSLTIAWLLTTKARKSPGGTERGVVNHPRSVSGPSSRRRSGEAP